MKNKAAVTILIVLAVQFAFAGLASRYSSALVSVGTEVNASYYGDSGSTSTNCVGGSTGDLLAGSQPADWNTLVTPGGDVQIGRGLIDFCTSYNGPGPVLLSSILVQCSFTATAEAQESTFNEIYFIVTDVTTGKTIAAGGMNTQISTPIPAGFCDAIAPSDQTGNGFLVPLSNSLTINAGDSIDLNVAADTGIKVGSIVLVMVGNTPFSTFTTTSAVTTTISTTVTSTLTTTSATTLTTTQSIQPTLLIEARTSSGAAISGLALTIKGSDGSSYSETTDASGNFQFGPLTQGVTYTASTIIDGVTLSGSVTLNGNSVILLEPTPAAFPTPEFPTGAVVSVLASLLAMGLFAVFFIRRRPPKTG